MLLNVTDRSSEPLQGQIVRQIRARILSGEIEAGESLPSIRGLAKQLQVSVITVQRAYESLEREGIILSRRGKGFFVEHLTEKKKTSLARQRLKDQIEPILKAARADGMTENDIQMTLEEAIGLVQMERV
jgi:GntR family transcriptional regulator